MPSGKKRKLADVNINRGGESVNKMSVAGTPKPETNETVSSGDEPDGFEVEKILDHRCEKGNKDKIEFFFIKWRGYSEADATWEPVANLNSCPQILSDYLMAIGKNKSHSANKSGVTETMAKSLEARLNKELKGCDNSILRVRKGEDGVSVDFTFRFNFDKFKAKHQAELKAWEADINKISDKNNEAKIEVENKVDFESAPEDFAYITDYRGGKNVTIPTEALTGCQCGPGNCHSKVNNKNQCCPAMAGVEFMYDSRGRVKGTLERRPIYECNSKCTCGPECLNRVVQKGRKIPLTIYRTEKKGWGVKTQGRIAGDTFVTEYVGEVITEEEAEVRGKVYDEAGATYLFDLDFNSMNSEYAVDAKRYGNVAHFFNHSCDPNLAIRTVWIECLEPSMPRLAFFSKREIKAGEELTFSYRDDDADEDEVHKKLKCHCGASNCRGYML